MQLAKYMHPPMHLRILYWPEGPLIGNEEKYSKKSGGRAYLVCGAEYKEQQWIGRTLYRRLDKT